MTKRCLREENVSKWEVGSKIKKREVSSGENNVNSLIKFVGFEMGIPYLKATRGKTMTNNEVPEPTHDHEALSDDAFEDTIVDGIELSLSRNEALFIDDSLSMLIERDGDANLMNEHRVSTVRPLTPTAGLPAPLDLIEKIGMAVLFTTDPKNDGKEASVTLEVTDLLMLREIAHSYVRVGDEPVGFNLKKKIYTVLYDVEYQKIKLLNNLLEGIDTTVLDKPMVVPKE